MEYEWQEAKREANLAKHGLDFILAPLVHEADFKLSIPSPRGDEARWVDVARVEGELIVLALVYTMRGEATRVISLRKANRKEKRRYEQAKDQALHQ
jgi:uncharacterized protein